MARFQSTLRKSTTRRGQSASELIAAAQDKQRRYGNAGTTTPAGTAAGRRVEREGTVNPRMLSPGERMLARQQQEILQRQALIQTQNSKIIERMDRLFVEMGLEESAAPETVDASEGTVELEVDGPEESEKAPASEEPAEVPGTEDVGTDGLPV